jgi:hypothetical protein
MVQPENMSTGYSKELSAFIFRLRIKATCFFGTLVTTYQTVLCHIPVNWYLLFTLVRI